MDDGFNTGRFILISVLLFAILIIWQTLFFRSAPQQPTPSVQDTVKTAEVREVQQEPQVVTDPLFTVKTKLYTTTFSKSGGMVSYKIGKVGNLSDIELVDDGSIAWGEVGISYSLPQDAATEYIVDKDTITITLVDSSKNLEKRITFYPDKYLIDMSLKGDEIPATTFTGKMKFTEENVKLEKSVYSYIVRTEKTIKMPLAKFKENKEYDLNQVTWFGIRTKYFLSSILNLKEKGSVVFSPGGVSFKTSSGNYSIYFGPLDYTILRKHNTSLGAAFDFGAAIIKPFSMAIYFLMQFLNKFISNFGFVIVVFALLMKILFFPLTRSTVLTSKRMQELKPKLETIQKIYKDNPQKLQQEMMDLYKKYKINPFSGCLTLIIQMPIFFALYQILNNSVNLKGAPFILWIRDLSTKDPYYILPILMGVTSILLSRIQQQGADTQTKILMYFMPVLMVFIFLSLPSGIVLYWLTFNVFGVFEALLIKRLEGRHGT